MDYRYIALLEEYLDFFYNQLPDMSQDQSRLLYRFPLDHNQMAAETRKR